MIGTVSFIMDLSFVLKWLKALFCFVFHTHSGENFHRYEARPQRSLLEERFRAIVRTTPLTHAERRVRV